MSTPSSEATKTRWAPVYAVAFGVSALITAEFLPVSLLTPIAHDLNISEGTAGQLVSASAIAALLSSLFIASVTRRINRRTVLLGFALLMLVSNLLVAVATSFPVMLVGRVFLGLGAGGFWALSTSIALRLVPAGMVPRALSIIFSGVAISNVIAAPLGSTLGNLIGWRGVFLVAAVLGLLSLVWQALILPSLPASGSARVGTLFSLLKRRRLLTGMAAILLIFGGNMAFFTYTRPFLEGVTGLGAGGVSVMLLLFGLATFVGTTVSGRLLEWNLRFTQLAAPLLLSVLSGAFLLLGALPVVTGLLMVLRGLLNSVIPVSWSMWVARSVPDEVESAGGLQVAAIQVAVTLGSALGGVVLDHSGISSVVACSGVALLLGGLLILFGLRERPPVMTEANA
ncbi:MFS transporter [Deinococcus ruber]|uniref:MFS transporter n=1 Tax=Deinococcus ruber TaxID=1848197 RepID=A0A918FIB1_9DEIO|nr:MFS transporter [Deinococcus ruber]GGR39264.1 MFS transporter [Deinococcus ruber]